MKKIALAALALGLAFVSPAVAMSGTVQTSGGKVLIWKNEKAHDEAAELYNAGVQKTNPMMILVLTSCIVDSGTKAVTTAFGVFTHDILITDGPNAGCRGNISTSFFKGDRQKD